MKHRGSFIHNRLLGSILLVITLMSLLVLGGCGDFSFNPFNEKETTTAGETTPAPVASDIPGTTEFIPTMPATSTGAPLAAPAYDMFIKIEGMDGESTDANHMKWVDVLEYGWGIEEVPGGTSRTTGSIMHLDLVVTKTLDKTSPGLAIKCSKGENIPSVILAISQAGGGRTQIMRYTLEDVVIKSIHVSGNAADEIRPVEEVSFSYRKITWLYTELDATGKAKGNVEFTWNVETSREE
ncbi:MAG: type VI secretion system tube protein Hcp [Dehalococcoidaceae bacterium]|nr:type VI secretion system tube protein Hcp [Dehalococcoidaceae bacterium]